MTGCAWKLALPLNTSLGGISSVGASVVIYAHVLTGNVATGSREYSLAEAEVPLDSIKVSRRLTPPPVRYTISVILLASLHNP